MTHDPWATPSPQPVILGSNAPGGYHTEGRESEAQWLCMTGAAFAPCFRGGKDGVERFSPPRGFVTSMQALREAHMAKETLNRAIKKGTVASIRANRCVYACMDDVWSIKVVRRSA